MIRLERVGKTYGQGAEIVQALRDVDLAIAQGERLGIVGPSGSGKTSLLNILGCLDRPTSGTVWLDGRDVFRQREAELTAFRSTTLGFVFQSFNLFDLLTARENVEYPLHLAAVGKQERRERAIEALGWVGLDGKIDRRPDQLSAGEKQRVAIARALVHRPRLVLADEPTANLDSDTGARIVALLSSLNEKLGATFVIATHDRAVIDSLDRVVTMRDGRLV
jgi:putative ABC transport system ATP-binding protein